MGNLIGDWWEQTGETLTPQERLSKMPYESQGIPLKDWIIK